MATGVVTLEEFAATLSHAGANGDKTLIVLEQGKPTRVWLSYSEYQALRSQGSRASIEIKRKLEGLTLSDVLDHPAFSDLAEDYEFPKLDLELRPVEFE